MSTKLPTWDLGILYKSPDDPQIDKDIALYEKAVSDFALKYDKGAAGFDDFKDAGVLLEALTEYEKLWGMSPLKAVLYFYFLHDIEAGNPVAPARLSLYENRLANVNNKILFFEISLGKIDKETQGKLLADPRLAKYRVFLDRVFDDARHNLSVPEEKIMNLKSLPSYDMWVSANERILNQKTIKFKGKNIPFATAIQMIPNLKTAKERKALSKSVAGVLESVVPFSEAEINAVFTNKKINDELRGYKTPFENTVKSYRNDPAAVLDLVKTVSARFDIAHRFYGLKARLLGLKRMSYSDRAAKLGTVKTKFTFDKSLDTLKKTFGELDRRYPAILEKFVKEKRVDAQPRVGKRSGAYCASSYENPTFVLLNHNDDLRSFTTFAHEMGHAFHSELSRAQGPLYSGYSMSLAETASTLFESIALEAILEEVSDKEKVIILHDKINEDIATIFRQIACFNFESDLHSAIREKGYIKSNEICDIHNKNMKAYLGPAFDLIPEDGLYFVHWSHIRSFFYVYSYAYGMLVSKALLRRLKSDKSFWPQIEKFLGSGGKDSPENILKDIGIDVLATGFWEEGLREIEDDISRLEKLTLEKLAKK